MLLILTISLCCFGIVSSKPKLSGPCADAEDPMACLHGILMHNDENVGEDHKAEDQYLRFKSELETGQKDIGVKNAEETFHGDLMHGGDADYNHQGELLPKDAPKDIGPEDLGQYMHGVLMHGDEEPGKDHSHDHKKKLEEAQPKGKVLPLDSEQLMHGVLMHGDENADLNHDHGEKSGDKDKGPIEPIDPNEQVHNLMHDGENAAHAHENDEDKQKNGGGPIAPQDPNEQMHDLMHDGEKVIHPDTSGVERKHPKDVSLKSLPSGDELHGLLMHGDNEMGHDHEKEHAERKNEPFKFDIEKIKEIVPEDILKTVNLEKFMKVDKEDYTKWKDEEKKIMGDKSRVSSFSFVVDSIFSNLDKIKQKFISKSNQNNEDNTEKNLKFAADTIEHLGHDPDDVRHDLELVGSTAPISERHKSFHLRNSKERHEM